MSGSIRIGIVGAGRIVRAEHVPRFRAIAGVELVAVANSTPASSRAAAAELGIARAFDDWQALVADPGVDAVLVGAWPVVHAPVTIAALAAGKHVLTEARMAATAHDARAMLRAALARPDLVAMVVPATFSAWADATIVRLLADGTTIGRVRHVQVAWDYSSPSDPADAWRWQRKASGDNVMALGILAEALARWLGPARALTASMRFGAVPRPGPNGPVATDIADHVVAVVDYRDDVTATIEMSARTNALATDHVTFHGTVGSLIVDLADQSIRSAAIGGPQEPVSIRAADRRDWTAEVDFIAAIRGERPVTLTDFTTGLDYMAFLEAIHRSAADGRRMVIEARA